MVDHVLTAGVCVFDQTESVAGWRGGIGALTGGCLLKPVGGSLQGLILNVLGRGAAAANEPNHTEGEQPGQRS